MVQGLEDPSGCLEGCQRSFCIPGNSIASAVLDQVFADEVVVSPCGDRLDGVFDVLDTSSLHRGLRMRDQKPGACAEKLEGVNLLCWGNAYAEGKTRLV